MPKRTDISSILIIGAGPIIIGQACEFDYSGTQACKALKDEGYRIILVNSNPATIMTDPGLADATYIEPITPAAVRRIIEKEKPDALLPTMGGQTALNTAMALADDGTLDEFEVELIGANREAIEMAEDRLKFREAMDRIGLESPMSGVANAKDFVAEDQAAFDALQPDEQKRRLIEHALRKAGDLLEKVGLPAIIRPSFTLGGTGGGIAYNRDEFEAVVTRGLDASPATEVLIEESVLGWKEFEMEVVRDRADNCIIICSIENFDPMGIHTGDSITVAPALTLTDKEYQIMRDASIAVLREIGVDTGGSNVQFAVDPATGRQVIIEMNPRVSRSSALASKATGFPIAKVAAKLAVGYTLDEIDNDITGVTPASFEPTIDYVVTKIPRFTFEKFPGTEAMLTTAMKSVGEAMSIGRNFQESLQKGLRSMETGLTGLNEVLADEAGGDVENVSAIRLMLAQPTPERVLTIAQAFRAGLSLEEIHAACHVDPWFLAQIEGIIAAEAEVREDGLPSERDGLLKLKSMGFSDARLAELGELEEGQVMARREALDVRPVYKRIDTCAGEFASQTPYMYSAYEAGPDPEDESDPTDREKIIILGGGPNRIGQGIEFDYCCVHAVYALAEAGYETIMVNCNPETVSTDYDTADRLYFEPLTAEDVIELVRKEQERGTLKGLIVQYGGQTPLKLARAIEDAGIPILGTSPDAIDLAEDRERFQKLLNQLGLRQPENGIAYSVEQSRLVTGDVGLPFVVRPSYVLGGRAMEIIRDENAFDDYLLGTLPSLVPSDIKARYPNDKTGQINMVLGRNPLLFDRYLTHAIEVDVDAVCDGTDVKVAGIMEHIEEAGIHSGDSACSLPPHSLTPEVCAELTDQTAKLAHALGVVGLMNVQFAIKDDEIFILEVNPRASRTVPFVAKATGAPIAKIAARVMAGEPLKNFTLGMELGNGHVAVKEAVFPFNRFPGVDTLLGPEMKSTGEVMGLDRDFGTAFAKSQLASGVRLPQQGLVFVSVRDSDKAAITPVAAKLDKLGFEILATGGTCKHLQDNGIEATFVKKVAEGRPHVLDAMKNGAVHLVINTTEGSVAIKDSYSLRRTALTSELPYYTTVAGARAAVEAIEALGRGALDVAPLQSYFPASF